MTGLFIDFNLKSCGVSDEHVIVELCVCGAERHYCPELGATWVGELSQSCNGCDAVDYGGELDDAGRCAQCTGADGQPAGYVALIGNISEGYKVVGPFDTFDAAAAATEFADSWVMELYVSLDKARMPRGSVPAHRTFTQPAHVPHADR
jgi:hypothetical protein